MERKNKTEYNTEYVREKRQSKRRQVRSNILETGERLTIILPKDQKDKLKELALSQEKGVNQLMRELIEEYLKDK